MMALMKKLVAVLISLLIPVSTTTFAFADALPSRFIITGSGFGHGVGLSQVGARGFALEGKSASDILTYYFPGTQITTAPVTQSIRVNIAHQSTYQAITGSNLQLYRGDGTTSPITVAQGATLKFAMVGKMISPTITMKGAPTVVVSSGPLFTVKWDGTIKVAGILLKYGSVELRAVARKL
jgi:hypothetical protein